MTVLENLEMGAQFPHSKRHRAETLGQVWEYFPRLAERKHQKAGTLSGGEQQMVAIGRGLMSRPKLMMLDEPSLGLAPVLVSTIFEIIRRINEQGTAILLIEQNVYHALSISDRGYVLENGCNGHVGPGPGAYKRSPHLHHIPGLGCRPRNHGISPADPAGCF